MARHFQSAAAFKAALEARLRQCAAERTVPFSTLQLKFVIERLLARLFRNAPPPWLLKGGFAMDLRFRPRARTTRDVDLSIPLAAAAPAPDLAELRESLQEAGDADLGDYLSYRIGGPRHERTNAPGGGARYPCEAVLLGKTYARFHIDVGCGDALVGEAEPLTGDDLLAFAGIGPATVQAIPRPLQFSEKVHAYTFPWSGRQNTRSKDLVDLVILIERGLQDVDAIRQALHAGDLVDEALRDNPHLELKRLPASSAQLKPIERLGRVLRRGATPNRLFDPLAALKRSVRNSRCYFQTVRSRVVSLVQKSFRQKVTASAAS